MVGLVEALSFFPLSTKRKVACTGPALSQLDQLRPRLRGPALELSTLGCSRTYNNKLQRTALGPVPLKAGPVHVYNHFKFQISKHNIFKITSEIAI
jgi:hypothetical protein